MSKKKILMVHNYYQIGGGEHAVFKNEVELLRKNGHEVIEYTRRNDELKESFLKLLISPFTTIWSFKTYFEVKKIIKNEKIDIVHCHNTFPLISPSVYYAAIHANIPVVQTIHNFRFLCPNGSFFCKGKVCEKCNEKWNFNDAIKNKCYRNSKIQTIILVAMLKFHRLLGTYKKISYIFLTDFNRSKFSKLINIDSDQVFIKPNFINQQTISYVVNDNKTFIYFGRLDKGKGIIELVTLWKDIDTSYQLHIFGSGECEDEVKKLTKNETNIKLFGFRPQQEIFEDLVNGGILITPYIWYEGFPMNISECLSLGVPIISSNVGNACDLVLKSKSGVCFDVHDVHSLKKAMNKVLENKMVFSNNAKAYFYNNLTDSSNYKRIIEIYDKCRIH